MVFTDTPMDMDGATIHTDITGTDMPVSTEVHGTGIISTGTAMAILPGT